MQGPAFVTGGTGFVGGAVVRHLLAQGREVVALARTGAAADELARAGGRPVRGDVRDPASFERTLRGCEVVFHVAGLNASCLRDPSPLFRTNVEGTRNVLDAAARAGIRRFVHTSSAATIGESAGSIGREGTSHRGWFLTDYERSKFDAERLVMERGPAVGLEVVCVNPASVQGPGRGEGSARLLRAAARGRLPMAVDVWTSLVDVDDCARGHALAAERGVSGERYLLCGGSFRTRDLLRLLEQVTARRPRTVFAPGWILLAAAAGVEAAARALGRSPVVCREVARAGLHGHRFDGSQATGKLGLAYTPVQETLRRTLEWFEAEGLLAGRSARGGGRRPVRAAYDGNATAHTRPEPNTRRSDAP